MTGSAFNPVAFLFEHGVADPELATAWAEPFGTDLRAAWWACPRAGWLLRIAAASGVEARAYARASLVVARRVVALVPEVREVIGEDLRVLEAWADGRASDEAARAAMQHAGREASRCAGRQGDPPGPERDERLARSLAMRAVERAAESALGRITARYVSPTAADLGRSVVRLRGLDLDEHERGCVEAIRAVLPAEAIAEGMPRRPVVIPEPCYVEVRFDDPEAWRLLAALWTEAMECKHADALNAEDERWQALAPAGRVTEVRNALGCIASGEYDLIAPIRLDEHTGRLRFEPPAFPYGGVAPMEWLAGACGARVVAVDDGGGRQERG